MAILAFQKPDKVIMLEGTDTVGRSEFVPLEPGYGTTIGNALRRILLASLEGFAISQIDFVRGPGVRDHSWCDRGNAGHHSQPQGNRVQENGRFCGLRGSEHCD